MFHTPGAAAVGIEMARGSITHLSRCEASLCAVGSVLCSCLRAHSLANSPWQSCTPGREKQRVRHSPCAGMICTCPALTAPGAGVGLCSGAAVCLCSPRSVCTHTSPSQQLFWNCPCKTLSPCPVPPDSPLRCSEPLVMSWTHDNPHDRAVCITQGHLCHAVVGQARGYKLISYVP